MSGYDPAATTAELLRRDPAARTCYETLLGLRPTTLDGIAACYGSTKGETMTTSTMREEDEAAYQAWRAFEEREPQPSGDRVEITTAEYERLTALAKVADEDPDEQLYQAWASR